MLEEVYKWSSYKLVILNMLFRYGMDMMGFGKMELFLRPWQTS